jgi:hypothetical protein
MDPSPLASPSPILILEFHQRKVGVVRDKCVSFEVGCPCDWHPSLLSYRLCRQLIVHAHFISGIEEGELLVFANGKN